MGRFGISWRSGDQHGTIIALQDPSQRPLVIHFEALEQRVEVVDQEQRPPVNLLAASEKLVPRGLAILVATLQGLARHESLPSCFQFLDLAIGSAFVFPCLKE